MGDDIDHPIVRYAGSGVKLGFCAQIEPQGALGNLDHEQDVFGRRATTPVIAASNPGQIGLGALSKAGIPIEFCTRTHASPFGNE